MYQRQAVQVPDATAAAPKAELKATPSVAQETDTVSLQSLQEAPRPDTAQPIAPGPPPEVFAEIWKDGVKIGSVYTNGQAVLPSVGAGVATGSHNSARMPYVRAQELSLMVGGEVRYVDLRALQVAQTRNQLRTAYGA